MNYKDKYKQLNKVGEQDNILCESCCLDYAVDIHHIQFRSQLGSDEESNLIALCRDCHNMAHDGDIKAEDLRKIADNRIQLREMGIIRGYKINLI
jgi:5-methylcytosine-specific restriction endonuclease McrA